ncbi:MAG: glycosyltransferase family 4 protein [Gammaproteobacteria bacterium]
MVFENECRLLRSAGHEVTPLRLSNDQIDDSTPLAQLRAGLGTVWSPWGYRVVKGVIAQVHPHVAHFHNTFALLSPSVYAACRRSGVPVVQTLHNYRLICPSGLLFRRGEPCEVCVGRVPWRAIQHRCYRDSRLASSAVTAMLAVNRGIGTFRWGVDRYIALTRFAAQRLIAGGLPRERISVKPNFLPDPPSPREGMENFVLYVGRLSREKGVGTLLKALRLFDTCSLKILGTGPLEGALRQQAVGLDGRVLFLGQRPREEVTDFMQRTALVVIPSEWYEGFPMVVLEAYACAKPVVASSIGSLDGLVLDRITGRKFKSGDAVDLARVLREALSDHRALIEMGQHARQHFEQHFSAPANLEALLTIYREALGRRAILSMDNR